MDAKDGEESDEVNKTMLNEQSKYKTDPKNQVIQFINSVLGLFNKNTMFACNVHQRMTSIVYNNR